MSMLLLCTTYAQRQAKVGLNTTWSSATHRISG